MEQVNPYEQMPKGKKTALIIGIIVLAFAMSFSSYAAQVVLPRKLAAIDAMSYYSTNNAIAGLGMVLILPLLGLLYNKLGTKVVVFSGIILQFAARICAIFCTDPILYIVFWLLNGLGQGMWISAPYALMAEVVDAADRAKFFGVLATTAAVGTLLGPLLTGVIMDAGLYQLGFIAYAPLVIIAMVIIGVLYKNKKSPTRPGKLDVMGIVWMVVMLCCFIVWVSMGNNLFPYFSTTGIIILAAFVVTLVLLIVTEKKAENPSIPVKMFKYNRFSVVFFCYLLVVTYATVAGGYGYAYVQQVMQASSTVSSTITMPQTIVQAILGVTLGAFVGKKFAKRFRPFGILAMALYTIAMGLFWILKPDSSIIIIYVATALGGVSQAFVQSSFPSYYMTQVKREEIGSAQALYTMAASVGSTIFAAVAGAIMNAGYGFTEVFMLGFICCGLGLVIAIFGFRFTKEEKDACN